LSIMAKWPMTLACWRAVCWEPRSVCSLSASPCWYRLNGGLWRRLTLSSLTPTLSLSMATSWRKHS
jgi:hypothetical protein